MRSFRRFLFLWFIGLGAVLVIAGVALIREIYREPPVVKIVLHEARMRKQEGRERAYICSCDVALDNRSEQELSVAYYTAPYDGLRIILWHGDLNVAEYPYASPAPDQPRRAQWFTVPPGQSRLKLDFEVEVAPGLGVNLSAQLMGSLPGSRFEGVLESNAVRIKWPNDRATAK